MDIHGLQIWGLKSPMKTHAKEGHKEVTMRLTPANYPNEPDIDKHHKLYYVTAVTDGRSKVML